MTTRRYKEILSTMHSYVVWSSPTRDVAEEAAAREFIENAYLHLADLDISADEWRMMAASVNRINHQGKTIRKGVVPADEEVA